MSNKLCLLAIVTFVFVTFGDCNVAFRSRRSALPSYIHVCRRNDPNLSKCLKESVEKLRPLLKEGIPDFDIPGCEPLQIPEVAFDQGTGPMAMKSIYSDIKVYGPSEFKLKSAKIDLAKNRIRIKFILPELYMTSNYEMDGKIMMMPITGKGISNGNFTNIDAVVTMQGQRIKKDEKEYFDIKDFYVDFSIGHADIHLGNLFNGDKELGEATNRFLNDNWKSVADELKPLLEDTIATIFKKFANKIFHKYPIDVLLPQ